MKVPHVVDAYISLIIGINQTYIKLWDVNLLMWSNLTLVASLNKGDQTEVPICLLFLIIEMFEL